MTKPITEVETTAEIVYPDTPTGDLQKIADNRELAKDLFIDNKDGVIQAMIEKVRADAECGFDEFDLEKKGDRDAFRRKGKIIGKIGRLSDNTGKAYKEELSIDVNKIDPNRKILREAIFQIEKDTLQPLIDWEVADALRVEEVKGKVDVIKSLPDANIGDGVDSVRLKTSAELKVNLETLEKMKVGDDYGNLKEVAELHRYKGIDALKDLIKTAENVEAKQIESDKKEAARVEKEKKANEEKLRLEGVAREKKKSDAAAKTAREAIAKGKQDVIDAENKAEEVKKEAVEALKKSKAKEKQDAIDKKEEVRLAAEKATNAANEKTAREAKEKETARKAREANVENNRKVNKAAVDALVKMAGISIDDAKKVVIAVAKKQIPGMGISY